MRRAVLVFNAASGAHLSAGAKRAARRRSEAMLRSAGLDVMTTKGSFRRQIAASLDADADCVVVDGGDGTIRAVMAAHIAHARKTGRDARPIGILPGGTMNLLANDFRVPLDREAAAGAIGAGKTVSADVGVLRAGRGDRQELFLHSCLTGLPVRIGTHRERWRGRMPQFGQVRLAWHALTTLGRDRPIRAELAGGEQLEGRSFVLVVGELGDQLLPVPSRRTLTGGEVTVLAVSADSPIDLVRIAVRGVIDRIDADEGATIARTPKVTLSTDRRRIHVMMDGESAVLAAPVTVTLLPSAIQIFSTASDARAVA